VPAPDVHTIESLRKAGKHINVWTCNDTAAMQKLIAAGVTGIVTDYPDRLAPLL
jgi:glycerophosphoryl diester phosphodiesterase